MDKGKNELESIIGELRGLSKMKPLPREGVEEAKRIMTRLREMGFTNMEISELTDGGWSESTVKLYTRGSTVKDPSPKNNAMKLLTDIVDRGLTMDRIGEALSLLEELSAKSLTIGDASGLLEEAKRFKVDVAELFRMHKEMRACALTVEDVKNALAYKAELESAGFTIDALPKLREASKAYGGFAKVIEAVVSYGKLETLKVETEKVALNKSELNKKVEELKKLVEDLERRKAGAEDALKTYEELRKMGFEAENLKMLSEASSKYGGVEETLTAINTYTNLKKLEEELSKREGEKGAVETELKMKQAEYAHLQSVIAMCDKLLYDLKFSIPAITDIYDVAKNYGEPIEVLKAVRAYGDMKMIEKNIEKLSSRKLELEANIDTLRGEVNRLKSASKELADGIATLFDPLVRRLDENLKTLNEGLSKTSSTMLKAHEEHMKALDKAMTESADQMREIVKGLGKEYGDALALIEGRLSEATRKLGGLEKEIERMEHLKTIGELMTKPMEVKEPPINIFAGTFVYVTGLRNFIDLHKSEIKDYYSLESKIEDLQKLILDRLRQGE